MVRAAEIPAQLSDRPFTVDQARALGVSRTTLRGSRFRRGLGGVYVPAGLSDDVVTNVRAAQLLVPGAVASHHTAAELRRLPVPVMPELHVTRAATNRVRIRGLRVHEGETTGEVQVVRGVPALRIERTFVDLAGVRPRGHALDLVELVVLGDAAVRRGWCTCELLTARTVASAARGCARARAAARLVRAGVDSPMETRLRLLLVLAGLPEPEVGFAIMAGPGPIAWPDLAYPSIRLAIEYDGGHHRTSARQWSRDKARGRLVRDLDWDLLEVTANDLALRAAEIISWVHERLWRHGYPGTPDVPSTRWARYPSLIPGPVRPRNFVT